MMAQPPPKKTIEITAITFEKQRRRKRRSGRLESQSGQRNVITTDHFNSRFGSVGQNEIDTSIQVTLNRRLFVDCPNADGNVSFCFEAKLYGVVKSLGQARRYSRCVYNIVGP